MKTNFYKTTLLTNKNSLTQSYNLIHNSVKTLILVVLVPVTNQASKQPPEKQHCEKKDTELIIDKNKKKINQVRKVMKKWK